MEPPRGWRAAPRGFLVPDASAEWDTLSAFAALRARDECHSLGDAMAWAQRGVERLIADRGPGCLVPFVGLAFHISSTCSGIDAPVLAARIGAAAINASTQQQDGRGGMRITQVFACDILKQCQMELLWQAEPPQHLFGDMLEMRPP